MICSKCGTKCQDTAKYCTVCGEHFARPNNDPRRKDPSVGRKQKYIVAAIAAVILIVAIILVFTSGGNEAEKAAEEVYEAVIDMDIKGTSKLLPPALVEFFSESLDLADSKFRIKESKVLSDSKVEEIDALYGIRYGTKEGYIDKATVVYANVTYHGKSLSEEPLPMVMVEIGGDWYLEPLSTAQALEEIGLTDEIPDILS